MDDDYDPNVSGGGSRGSTSLPKFNHLYPILFFSHFIRFCGANKCGGPLSSPDGRIESIVTLEDSHLPIPLTSASYPESMDDLLDTISFHWRDSTDNVTCDYVTCDMSCDMSCDMMMMT